MIENAIAQAAFTSNSEKTFIDKILGKQDIEIIRKIIRKDRLTRSEVLDVLYMLSSSESKLLNYSQWERYVILKFFIWIREFVKIVELLYDYQDELKNKGSVKLSPLTKKMLDNCERMIEHNTKFMVDLYLNIGRTSLSLGGAGFLEILKNKYEISYPEQAMIAKMQTDKKGFGVMKG